MMGTSNRKSDPVTRRARAHRSILLLAAVVLLLPELGVGVAGSAAPTGARITGEGWFAPRRRTVRLPAKITKAFEIPIHGFINTAAYEDIQRKVVRCRDDGAELVIFDMDTPGSDGAVMRKIVNLLTEDLNGVYRVAYVNREAYGAGAMISLACHEIVMSPRGMIGDGSPKLLSLRGSPISLPTKDRAKIEPVVVAEARRLAAENDHNAALCEGMISVDIELWLVRNLRTRELRVVDPQSRNWRRKVVGAPGVRPEGSSGRKQWEFITLVDPADRLVTLNARQAKRYGLTEHVFRSMKELEEHYNLASPAVALTGPAGQPWGAASGEATTGPAPQIPPGARVTDEGWFAPRRPQGVQVKLPRKVTKAFVIQIHDGITKATYEAVRRKVVRCRTAAAEMVILDMNTPGGDLMATRKIVKLLMDDLEDVYRVAYVNPEAYSAGAIISLACHEIVMNRRSVIGDAMPIIMQGDLSKAKRAKIESPLLAEARILAVENGYNQALCEGMITIKVEVWLIRHRRTRELRVVDADSNGWRRKVAGAPGERKKNSADKDKAWEFLKTVDPDHKLVTMNTREALRYGLVEHVFRSRQELEKHYGLTVPAAELIDTWSETMVTWLTSPPVVAILVLIGIMAFYSELRTPGLGVPGAVAVVCFGIVFGSHYLTGLAAWWEVALFALGLVLLALEVFVIPGFGVAGVGGIVCCTVGLLAIFVDNPPDRLPIPSGALSWSMFSNGVFALGCAFVLSMIGGAILAKYLANIPIVSKVVLGPVEASDEAPVTADAPVRKVHVGSVGVVESMCRPVGKVRFGQDLVDASSEGEIVGPGARVRVLRYEGNRVVIEKVEDA